MAKKTKRSDKERATDIPGWTDSVKEQGSVNSKLGSVITPKYTEN
jgi:hypothetical protein